MITTIPATWTQSPGCLPSGDLWLWGATSNAIYSAQALEVLGGPSDTSGCYPPSFQPTPSYVVAATACPDGFTYACNKDANQYSTICCPSGAYSFGCAAEGFGTMTMYCASSYTITDSTILTLTFTEFGPDASTLASYTAPKATKADSDAFATSDVETGPFPTVLNITNGPMFLWAMGVLVSSTTATPTISSTRNSAIQPSASNPSAGSGTNSSADSSLSAGAKAGIGVGVAICAIAVFFAAWVVYRRRTKRSKISHGNNGAEAQQPPEIHSTYPPELESFSSPQPDIEYKHRSELRSQFSPQELASPEFPISELDGQEARPRYIESR